jgi:hypothetical protein
MLRDARRKLRQHGKHSFSGKEAKKEVAAALAELANRKMDVPPEGQERTQWDTKEPPSQEKKAPKRTARKKRENETS